MVVKEPPAEPIEPVIKKEQAPTKPPEPIAEPVIEKTEAIAEKTEEVEKDVKAITAIPKPSAVTKQTTPLSGTTQASNNGSTQQRANYKSTLLAWLAKHKKYPRRARKRGMEGTGTLYIAVDQDGNILDYRIEESTGFRTLDKEIEAMIKRAQPLPIAPSSINQAKMEFTFLVEFLLD